jgi:ArsR family transcriptional regulator, arsenate/arsenite/antimonite-responsive transcriptional repressor
MGMDALTRHAAQFAALGHPARLAILRYIVQAGGEGVTTTEVCDKLAIPWTTLNHHLDRLVSAELVKARRDGRASIHKTDFKALKALTDFLWKDCCNRGRAGSACC